MKTGQELFEDPAPSDNEEYIALPELIKHTEQQIGQPIDWGLSSKFRYDKYDLKDMKDCSLVVATVTFDRQVPLEMQDQNGQITLINPDEERAYINETHVYPYSIQRIEEHVSEKKFPRWKDIPYPNKVVRQYIGESPLKTINHVTYFLDPFEVLRGDTPFDLPVYPFLIHADTIQDERREITADCICIPPGDFENARLVKAQFTCLKDFQTGTYTIVQSYHPA
jgi:hypothetical protein